MKSGFQVDGGVHKDDKGPIVVVVPGLTSDSDAAVRFLSSILVLLWNLRLIIISERVFKISECLDEEFS